MSAAVVLQARMGSRRLPGKTLAPLAGQTVLAHCVERLRLASGLPVVVATTTRAEDDCVAREGEALGVTVVRGHDEDVLARFLLAADELSLAEIVRATADNPAVDIDAPGRVLDLLRANGADHVTETGLPYGTAVEAIAVPALLRAAAMTADPADREHVTTFLVRDPRFVSLRVPAPAAVRQPGLRLTVDTAEDLDFVRKVFQRSGAPQPRPVPLAALIAAAATLSDATLSDTVPSGH